MLAGWNPDVVDYSKRPGLTAEKLAATLEADTNMLHDLGYAATLLFIDDAETAFDVVKAALGKEHYDCVLIGARVRKVDEHCIVFERLINAVHKADPHEKIWFNTNPSDIAEAIER